MLEWWLKWWILLASIAFVVGGGLVLVLVPQPLLENWLPGSTVAQRGKLLGVAAQIVLFGLGGVIAIVGVALSFARRREERAAAARDGQRLLDARQQELQARFVSTIELLAADEMIKRTAALYALGGLADDWATYGNRTQVQVCIDVLCAYLRARPSTLLPQDERDELAVRDIAFSVLRQHLLEDALHHWGDYVLDLSRLNIDSQIDLTKILLWGDGSLRMNNSIISTGGELELRKSIFQGSSSLDLSNIRVDGGAIDLKAINIVGEAVISLENLTIKEAGEVTLAESRISAGTLVRIDRPKVLAGELMLTKLFVLGELHITNPLAGEDGTISLNGSLIGETEGVIMIDEATLRRDGRFDTKGIAPKTRAGTFVQPDGSSLPTT